MAAYEPLLIPVGMGIMVALFIYGWPSFITINKHYHYHGKDEDESED